MKTYKFQVTCVLEGNVLGVFLFTGQLFLAHALNFD